MFPLCLEDASKVKFDKFKSLDEMSRKGSVKINQFWSGTVLSHQPSQPD